jgi:hypothetical protein
MSIALFILIALTTGCKVEGTGTGNPMQPATSPVNGSFTASEIIAHSTCELTTRCHNGANLAQCMNSVAKMTSYSSKLGFPEGAPLTMLEIRDLEIRKIIHPKMGHLKQCVDAISTTPCESSKAVGAYLPASVAPYEGTVDLLTKECNDIFTSESQID